jgi:hypothetical protein
VQDCVFLIIKFGNQEKEMSAFDKKSLSDLLIADVRLRSVEPHIFSVLARNEVGNTYDNKFGTFYDLAACNPLYNRLIWGYATSKFASLVNHALQSANDGVVLDIGCGSLAFTARTYSRYSERPVVCLSTSRSSCYELQNRA